MTNQEILLRNRLSRVQQQQYKLYKEASDLINTTPSRRIKINITLDTLATTERKLIKELETLQ